MPERLSFERIEKYRDPVVERFMWPKGTPEGCCGGHFISLITGRSLRFTFQQDGDSAECYLSAEEHTRVTDHEATNFFLTVHWKPVNELNATTARQNYLRCWEVCNA